MANSYSAEFGRSASGAINILTKSGGNQVRGARLLLPPRRRLRQAELLRRHRAAVQDRAVRRHRRRPDRAEQALLLRVVGAARQRALGAGEHPDVDRRLRRRASATTPAPTCRSSTDEHNLFGKGTYLASQNHTMNATYMYDHRDLTNQQTGGNSAGDHGYDDKRRAWFFVGNLTSVLRAQHRERAARERVAPGARPRAAGRLDVEAGNPLPDRAVRPRQQRAAGAGRRTTTSSPTPPACNFVAKGAHDLKFGFEMNIVPDDQHHQPVVQRAVRVPAGPAGDRRRPDVAAVPLHAGRRAARRAGGADARRRHLLGVRQQPVAAGERPHHQPRRALRLAVVARRSQRPGHPRPTSRSSSSGSARSPATCKRPELQGRAERQEQHRAAPRRDLGSDRATARTVVRGGYGIYYDQINTTTMRGVVAGYPGFITTQIANDSRSGARILERLLPEPADAHVPGSRWARRSASPAPTRNRPTRTR